MRKVLLSMMVSVDGYIEDANKEIDWHVWDGEMEAYMLQMLTHDVDTILLGRKAYQLMEDYWPASKEPIAASMNNLPKLVFSKQLSSAKWNNTRIISGNIQEEINTLKRMPGKDLVLFGGAEIASEFMRLGLIDEYMLIINPVILGGGNLLFKQQDFRTGLQVQFTKTFNCGNVVISYTPAKQ